MTYNFCTLFNSGYLTKGLALYRSMEKHCGNFHLYIFAFDKITYDVLKKNNFTKATIISLVEFEDEELLRVKPTRSAGEYCWTATSSIILYVLEKYKVESCTYIDADIFFYSSPQPIFEELADKSILLTGHRYSQEYLYEKKISGIYCVQFITFKNDEKGLTALKWWRSRCLEWCYAYYEDGKFGDQLYLDDWTERFEGVHVLKHLGGGVAPWNVQQYDFENINDKIIGTVKKSGERFEVIFFHFHSLRFYKNNLIDFGERRFTKNIINTFFILYLKFLFKLKEEIKKLDDSFDPNGIAKKSINPKVYIRRKIRKSYNIFDLKKILESDSSKQNFIPDN